MAGSRNEEPKSMTRMYRRSNSMEGDGAIAAKVESAADEARDPRRSRKTLEWPVVLTICAGVGAVVGLGTGFALRFAIWRMLDYTLGLGTAVGTVMGGLVGIAWVVRNAMTGYGPGQIGLLELLLGTAGAAVLATLWRANLVSSLVLLVIGATGLLALGIGAVARYWRRGRKRNARSPVARGYTIEARRDRHS